jgi:hypothetical protein
MLSYQVMLAFPTSAARMLQGGNITPQKIYAAAVLMFTFNFILNFDRTLIIGQ